MEINIFPLLIIHIKYFLRDRDIEKLHGIFPFENSKWCISHIELPSLCLLKKVEKKNERNAQSFLK